MQKRFTDLLENYSEKKLKSLSELIIEEASEDEFNKEIEIYKSKNSGKIRNKKISNPAVQAVEIQKEEIKESDEIMDKPIWGKPPKDFLRNTGNTGEKVDYSKEGKTWKRLEAARKAREGKKYTMRDGKIVEEEIENIDERTLTSKEKSDREDIVKSMKKNKQSFKKLYGDRAKNVMYATATKLAKEQTEEDNLDYINEESASGHSLNDIHNWLTSNGYNKVAQKGKHPKYVHKDTGHVVPGVNPHGKGNEAAPKSVRTTLKAVSDHRGESYISIENSKKKKRK